MTALELIKDTFEYYESDPSRRAMEEDSCKYMAHNGKRCAVGRWIDDNKLEKLGLYFGIIEGKTVDQIPSILNVPLDSILKDEVQNISMLVWRELQVFHDSGTYWLDNEQSMKDRKWKKEYLLEKFSRKSE